jgi:hypothetical protein
MVTLLEIHLYLTNEKAEMVKNLVLGIKCTYTEVLPFIIIFNS